MMRMLSKNRAKYLVNVARCVISAGTALFAMQHSPESAIIVAAGAALAIAVLSVHSAWEERHYWSLWQNPTC